MQKTVVSNFYSKTVLSEQDFSANKGLSLSSLGESFEPPEPSLSCASIDVRKGHMAKDCRQPKTEKGKEKGAKGEKGEKGKGKEKEKEKGKGKEGKSSGKSQSKGKHKGKKGLRSAEHFDLATPEESEVEVADLELEAADYEFFEAQEAWSETSETAEPIPLSALVRSSSTVAREASEKFRCRFVKGRCVQSDSASCFYPSV